jgi:hypothetical protein
MTIKQDELIKRLPENGYNVSKTARLVGYTEQSSRSGMLYESLRKRMAKAYSPEEVKAKIVKAEKKFVKDNDNSNYARMIELQAKVAKLTQDNITHQSIVNVNDTIAKLRANVPIDVATVNNSVDK